MWNVRNKLGLENNKQSAYFIKQRAFVLILEYFDLHIHPTFSIFLILGGKGPKNIIIKPQNNYKMLYLLNCLGSSSKALKPTFSSSSTLAIILSTMLLEGSKLYSYRCRYFYEHSIQCALLLEKILSNSNGKLCSNYKQVSDPPKHD